MIMHRLILSFAFLFSFLYSSLSAFRAKVQPSEVQAMWTKLCKNLPFQPPVVVSSQDPVCKQWIFAVHGGIYGIPMNLVIYEPILELLDHKEVKAILAHEYSHVKNMDVKNKLILNLAVRTIFAFIGGYCGYKHYTEDKLLNKILYFIGSGVFFSISPVLAGTVFVPQKDLLFILSACDAYYTRYFEKRADRTSVNICKDPESLISGLGKINAHIINNSLNPELDKQYIYQWHPLAAYPPFAERCRLIREHANSKKGFF